MKVKTRTDFNTYLGAVFYMSYKRALIIIASILALAMLAASILSYAGLLSYPGYNPLLGLVFGIYALFILPLAVYLSARRTYKSNLRVKEDIEYEFLPDAFTMTGDSFNARFSWDKVYKMVEMPTFYLVYSSNKAANIIPKKDFSDGQIVELRNLLISVPDLKSKLKVRS